MSTLSDNDNKILAFAWQCFKSPPDVDFNKLATLAGHTNPRSTANAFANIRKKLARLAEEAGATSSAPATPVKETPRKKVGYGGGGAKGKAKEAVHDAGLDDDDEDQKVVQPRTTPKRTGTKRKYTEFAYSSSDDDEHDDDMDVTIKKERSTAPAGNEDDDGDSDFIDATPSPGAKTPEVGAGAKVKGRKEGANAVGGDGGRRAGGAGEVRGKRVKVEDKSDEDGDGDVMVKKEVDANGDDAGSGEDGEEE